METADQEYDAAMQRMQDAAMTLLKMEKIDNGSEDSFARVEEARRELRKAETLVQYAQEHRTASSRQIEMDQDYDEEQPEDDDDDESTEMHLVEMEQDDEYSNGEGEYEEYQQYETEPFDEGQYEAAEDISEEPELLPENMYSAEPEEEDNHPSIVTPNSQVKQNRTMDSTFDDDGDHDEEAEVGQAEAASDEELPYVDDNDDDDNSQNSAPNNGFSTKENNIDPMLSPLSKSEEPSESLDQDVAIASPISNPTSYVNGIANGNNSRSKMEESFVSDPDITEGAGSLLADDDTNEYSRGLGKSNSHQHEEKESTQTDGSIKEKIAFFESSSQMDAKDVVEKSLSAQDDDDESVDSSAVHDMIAQQKKAFQNNNRSMSDSFGSDPDITEGARSLREEARIHQAASPPRHSSSLLGADEEESDAENSDDGYEEDYELPPAPTPVMNNSHRKSYEPQESTSSQYDYEQSQDDSEADDIYEYEDAGHRQGQWDATPMQGYDDEDDAEESDNDADYYETDEAEVTAAREKRFHDVEEEAEEEKRSKREQQRLQEEHQAKMLAIHRGEDPTSDKRSHGKDSQDVAPSSSRSPKSRPRLDQHLNSSEKGNTRESAVSDEESKAARSTPSAFRSSRSLSKKAQEIEERRRGLEATLGKMLVRAHEGSTRTISDDVNTLATDDRIVLEQLQALTHRLPSMEQENDNEAADIQESLFTQCFGISVSGQKQHDLFPLSFHRRGQLFDWERLQTFAMTTDNLRDERWTRKQVIVANSQAEFCSKFSAVVAGDADLAPALAPAAMAHLQYISEKHKSSSQAKITRYSQERLFHYHKIFSLGKNLPKDNDARQFLNEKAVRDMKRIQDISSAQAFLNEYGLLYAHRLFIGTCEIHTTTSRSKHMGTKKKTKVSSTRQYHPPTGGPNPYSPRRGTQVDGPFPATPPRNSDIEVPGQPGQELHVKPERTIIQCDFKPIYCLAEPGTVAEKFLKEAYEQTLSPVQSGLRYAISNHASEQGVNMSHYKKEGLSGAGKVALQKRRLDPPLLFGAIGDRPASIYTADFQRLGGKRAVLTTDYMRKLFSSAKNQKYQLALLDADAEKSLLFQEMFVEPVVDCKVVQVDRDRTTDQLLDCLSFLGHEIIRLVDTDAMQKVNAPAQIMTIEQIRQLFQEPMNVDLKLILVDEETEEIDQNGEAVNLVVCDVEVQIQPTEDLLRVIGDGREVSLFVEEYELLSDVIALKPEKLLWLLARANVQAGEELFELVEKQSHSDDSVDLRIRNKAVERIVRNARKALDASLLMSRARMQEISSSSRGRSWKRSDEKQSEEDWHDVYVRIGSELVAELLGTSFAKTDADSDTDDMALLSKAQFLDLVRNRAQEEADLNNGKPSPIKFQFNTSGSHDKGIATVSLHQSYIEHLEKEQQAEMNKTLKKEAKATLPMDPIQEGAHEEDTVEGPVEQTADDVLPSPLVRRTAKRTVINRFEYAFNILTWDDDPIGQEMKAAIFVNEGTHRYYLRSVGLWKKSVQLVQDDSYQSYSAKNTWILQRVYNEDSTFLIRSCDGNWILGAQKDSKVIGGDDYFLFLAKQKGMDDRRKFEDAFKWKFTKVREQTSDWEKLLKESKEALQDDDLEWQSEWDSKWRSGTQDWKVQYETVEVNEPSEKNFRLRPLLQRDPTRVSKRYRQKASNKGIVYPPSVEDVYEYQYAAASSEPGKSSPQGEESENSYLIEDSEG